MFVQWTVKWNLSVRGELMEQDRVLRYNSTWMDLYLVQELYRVLRYNSTGMDLYLVQELYRVLSYYSQGCICTLYRNSQTNTLVLSHIVLSILLQQKIGCVILDWNTLVSSWDNIGNAQYSKIWKFNKHSRLKK